MQTTFVLNSKNNVYEVLDISETEPRMTLAVGGWVVEVDVSDEYRIATDPTDVERGERVKEITDRCRVEHPAFPVGNLPRIR